MIQDVVIVGGGICGLSIGWRLAKRGLSVLILEKEEAGHGATWAAAGVLYPRVGEDGRGPAYTKLCVESQKLWPGFAREVEAESGVEIDYSTEGMLELAFEPAEEARLRRRFSVVRRLGVGMKWIGRRELRSMEPRLSRSARSALFNPLVQQVENRKLAQAAKKAFQAVGGLREHQPVDQLVIQQRKVLGVRAGRDTIRSRFVVLAAGAWSGGISGLDGKIRPPVRPVKGQMISLITPDDMPLLSHLLHYEDHFLVQRRDGRLLIGATVEEAGFDTTVTAGAMQRLLSVGLKVLPDTRLLPIRETWAGVRPGSPDGAPILGPSKVEGLVMATGHFRNGILLAPITANVISEYIVSGKLPELARAFTMRRFSS